MKSLKLNTILNLLDYYWEICDEDVEAGNRLICTIEDLLPFASQSQHDAWLDACATGTGDDLVNATYDVLWDAANDDYILLNEMLKGAEFSEWSVDGYRFQTSSVIRWDNDAKKPVATIHVSAPFLGFDHIDEWVWQGVSFKDFIEDTQIMLRAKIKQIAKRLEKEADFNV